MVGPMYRRIADTLRHKIESGEYEPGAQLPTEDELIVEHSASRNTVRAALKELTTLTLVEPRHGIGTFVVEQIPPIVTTLTTDPKTGSGGGEGTVYVTEVAREGREATTSPTEVTIRLADASVAGALKMPAGDEVISRHESRFVDSRPWSLQTSYYPKALLPVAPRLLDAASIEEGTVAYLKTCGIQQVAYKDAIEVRTPNDSEMEFFGLPRDGRIQVIEIYRVTFDQEGQRVRLTITIYRADRNRFLINVGNVPE